MKTLKSILALVALTLMLASCGDSDCKNCSMDGDFIGELCGDDLKEAESLSNVRCKSL
jgi:major membrane immunogen (membrane-anchored lipoprotein)